MCIEGEVGIVDGGKNTPESVYLRIVPVDL